MRTPARRRRRGLPDGWIASASFYNRPTCPHPRSRAATLLRLAGAAGAICAAPVLPLAGCRRQSAPAVVVSRPTDIRIVEVDHQFEEFRYRAPYQFGGRTVDRVTILNVNCRVRTWRRDAGKDAWGFGSMTLGNAWAFPAAAHDVGLGAMKALADELQPVTASLRRARPSDRSLSCARARVPARCRRGLVGARARRAHPQAVHARRRQRVRRGDSRRLRQGVRRQQLRDLRLVVHDARPVARPRAGVQGRVPRSLRPGRAARDDPGLSFGRRERSARGGRRPDADRRRAAEDARGVDSARRPDALQDQAERRQPRRRRRSHRPHRSDREPRGGGPRRRRLEVPARLQRGLSERRLPARLPQARARGDAQRLRSHPLHRAADGARSDARTAPTSCTRPRGCGRSSSTSR